MNPVAEITRSCHGLSKAEQHVRYRLARAKGLNTSEFELLTTLFHYNRPMNVKELAEELMLCSQAVTKITKRLQGLDMISLAKSEQDRRATMVDLREKGREIAEWETQIRQRLFAHALRGEDFNGYSDFASAMRVLETRVTVETHEALRGVPVPAETDTDLADA
ncbi:MAG: MarR family transcriptional regulator [Bacteroidia bacterium]|nr:MarR family transcriptional regulator [Bacteroidia bacterium]